jgi:magnesium-protoporphyrin O-methyltransferase
MKFLLVFLLCTASSCISLFQPQAKHRVRTILQRKAATVDDKLEVETYFNNEGFKRWNNIYSTSGNVNGVQLDIRDGHQQTIDRLLNWISNEDNTKKSLCDAGCGVGSLAIPAASKFKKVYGSDISASMVAEASRRAQLSSVRNIEFRTSDLEKLTGRYDTVSCVDVMIHYPTEKVRDLFTYTDHE